MKIVAIIQARVSSNRLPGKVVMKILGKEMFLHQVERVKSTPSISKLIMSTSVNQEDDAIEEVCLRETIECFRGDLNDVLDRFYNTAKKEEPDHVIRLTADCPLSDPELIENVIQAHLDGDYDYTSNCRNKQTFADGLDVEVFKFSVLEECWKKRSTVYEKEHVTPAMYSTESSFKTLNFDQDIDESNMRITVDYPEDFTLIEAVYKHFLNTPNFTSREALDYIKNTPELFNLNQKYVES